jgi:Icc-related predicted phosphoesterase
MKATRSGALRIVLISDTHECHRNVNVPDGDILVHAGDFTLFSQSYAAIRDFNVWLGELPHRYKLVIPGNHEYFLEEDRSSRSLLSNATLLIDESIEIEGLRFWGSPTTPLYGVAFGLSEATDRRNAYARIPGDTDVLITHTPPYGLLDVNLHTGSHEGCSELFEAVKRIQPSLHVFGHIHGAHGTLMAGATTFVNASLAGLDGGIAYSPIVVGFPRL